MSLRALKFSGHPPSRRPLPIELTLDTSDNLKQLLLQDAPAAYVVRNQDLDALRRFDDVFVDRGNKHKAKALWDILKGQKQIPLIRGSYTQPGRLTQGARDLLAKAAQHKDRNAYMIGVSDEIFEWLWQQGSSSAGAPTASALASEPLTPEAKLELLPESAAAARLAAKLVGDSAEIRLVRQLIISAAEDKREGTVLLLGDTGTGKDVVARCIHDCSPRRQEKFVAVNCGAISPYLFESELFGHVARAFPDAREKIGLWKVADKGTLFLDEIADLLPDHQVKVLRALEEKKILPVGATKPVPVDARVIAATNRDLFTMVKRNQFREDLFYRLRNFCIPMPALRTHRDDIAVLARALWKKISDTRSATLPPAVLAALEQYDWAGNVRELGLVLSQLYTLYPDQLVDVSQLRFACDLQGKVPIEARPASGDRAQRAKQVHALQHLQRVEEVLRAIEVTLRPFVRSQSVEPDAVTALQRVVRHRLNELMLLCLYRPLFNSGSAFLAVDRVRDRLRLCEAQLERGEAPARAAWKQLLGNDLATAVSRVTKAIKHLTNEVRGDSSIGRAPSRAVIG